MNTITGIQVHLDSRALVCAELDRIAERRDWVELNVAIDQLCAEFKAAQPRPASLVGVLQPA